MHNLMAVARDAAMRAGAILRKNIDGERRIVHKSEVDLVTEMDRQCETIVVETLLAAFPDHGILAEEETRIEGSSAYRWVIDPLDGTTNYAHRYPHFAVSIGLELNEEVVLGVVYDPMREEMFSAEKGRGAQLNDRPIGVSSTDTLIKSLLVTGFPYDRITSRANNLNYFASFLMACQDVRRSGSASLDLCAVAAGRLDGYWELKLKPWDVAAGSLILTEAGGRATDFGGERFSIHDQQTLATNGLIHGLMLEIIAPLTDG